MFLSSTSRVIYSSTWILHSSGFVLVPFALTGKGLPVFSRLE